MSNTVKFIKTAAGTYTSGRWTIARTYCWELLLDDCKVMGYTSLAAAKNGAADYAAKMVKNLDAA